MEYFVVEYYCTCIIEILSYFFILQSLTTSKMRKFQTLKLSQFHKEKTCWTENWWSSGIMSNFLGEFFYVLGVKKNFENFFKNILASALKSCTTAKIRLLEPLRNKFTGKTFQAAQLTHERFLTIDHSCKIFF